MAGGPLNAPRSFLSLLAAGALVLAGCQSPNPATMYVPSPLPPTPTLPSATGLPTLTPAPTVAPPTASAPTVEVRQGFLLNDPTVGLAALTSYRATFVQSFNGTRAGAPEAWSRSYTLQINRATGLRELTVEIAGPTPSKTTWLELEGALYTATEGQPCQVAPRSNATALAEWYEPAGFLAGVAGGEAVGPEALDGLAATHYTFGDAAVGALDPLGNFGEFWMADDGGYLLRYRLVKQGGTAYFGDGVEGLMTWDYTLVEANGDVSSRPPQGCPLSVAGLPQLPDAADLSSLPGRLSYTTAEPPAAVAEFYTTVLADAGWAPTAPPLTGDHLARLAYALGDLDLTVTVTAGDGAPATVELLLIDNTPP